MTNNITRKGTGADTGNAGHFATTSRGRSSVALAEPSLDQAAVDRARQLALKAFDREQELAEYRLSYSDADAVNRSVAVARAGRTLSGWDEADTESRAETMRILGVGGATHLLEPGQRLGTDGIAVEAGAPQTADATSLALLAQHEVAEAHLPGEVALTATGDEKTVFEVRDESGTSLLEVHTGYFSISAKGGMEDDEDFTTYEWTLRSEASVFGPSVSEGTMARALSQHFEGHRTYRELMRAIDNSKLRDAGEMFGSLEDQSAVEFSYEGQDYTLDASGGEPVVAVQGQRLHPAVSKFFLDHVSEEAGCADGNELFGELRSAFRKAGESQP